MPNRLKTAKNKCVGTKQTQKAIEAGSAVVVYVAKDAETKVTSKVIELCMQKGIECVFVDTMRQLGEFCGIEIGAASAAILKD
ncbi:ribosomal L7Ae/L30e/S12e/Gadd45 family protein [Calorimonas adulescens]|jgi:Ribosomal protein L7Ae/L30e/S12e/Gadd45 family.|uniref:50S ribosomal protein L7Ae-like protein n=1 Tax=Calorimonas adulescens TaxID=2606906 RepID=A0A5D8QEV5_9THEO|nr:ribosomal L7Ae/L30e/S12e/Gadd45 family protein [Calorimonas adulescens]TZE82714.1 50S ribosomal protein L7Ae-like protein [Calorimonas adulescens]